MWDRLNYVGSTKEGNVTWGEFGTIVHWKSIVVVSSFSFKSNIVIGVRSTTCKCQDGRIYR